MLGFQLASHGSEKKVRQILDDLLGPVYSLQNDPELRKNHKILSVDKHELLREVLNNLQSSTSWQRIFMEYQQQLQELDVKKKLNGVNGSESVDSY